MITIIEGNILDSDAEIIGHQVNCQGAMNSGVAKQIRSKYPVVFKHYEKRCEYFAPEAILGDSQLIKVGVRKYVANLFGQLHYGRRKMVYTDYDALRRALTSLKRDARGAGLSIALPYNIGCGLARGDWDGVVYPMLQEIFSDYPLQLYKYEG